MRGTFWNGLGQLLAVALALLLTPFLLQQLGAARFGLWAVTFAALNALPLFDLGLIQALTKLSAEAIAQGDMPRLNALTGSALLLLVGLAGLWTILVMIFLGPILELIAVPGELRSQAFSLFTWGVLVIAAGLVASVLQAVLVGAQRLDRLGQANLVLALANAAGMVAALAMGYGLAGLMVNAAANELLTVAIWLRQVRRSVPGLDLREVGSRREVAHELLAFGWKVQFTQAGTWVTQQWNKLAAGHFLGLASAGAYEIGARAANNSILLPLLLLPAILPAAAELNARGDRRLLKDLYARSARYVFLLATPLAFFLLFNAPVLVTTWLGEPNGQAALVIQGLAAAYWVNLLTAPGTILARGIGQPGLEAQYAILSLVLQVVLGIALVQPFGIVGLLGASLLATLAGSIYFLLRLASRLGLGITDLSALYFRPLLAAAACALIPAAGLAQFPLDFFRQRVGGIGLIAAAGIATGAGFFAVLWLWGYLDRRDLRLVQELFGRPRLGETLVLVDPP